LETNIKKTVVVVGGGFAGINFIKSLAKNKRFNIILVDINNYHFFPPLLYQVAAAFIEPSNISYPFRRMFQQKENIRFHLGSLLRVNTDVNNIETNSGKIRYDYLVLAVGTESNYFGMENVKQNSLPMKTINDALNLRNHLLISMENAVRENIASEREKHLNIVIAGGGPTGVEIAGMLAEMENYISEKEYPEITNLKGHIYLIDAANVLLGPMSKTAQQEATKVLNKLGVNIKLKVSVKDYADGKVLLNNGETILTDTLIWTSGVIGKEISGLPADSIGRGKRVLVDQYNKVKGTRNIFAIGDICLQTTDSNNPNGHPQLAQVAIQQGKLLAANISQLEEGKHLQEFKYKDRGSMAIISKYKAVADLPKFSFKGYFAWLIWLFIHIMPIAGFRNKIKLAFNWFWAFISNNPTLRLIIRPIKKINQ
jgi:NADH dehydrogenase